MSYLFQNECSCDQETRNRSLGECNSHTKLMVWHFYRSRTVYL